MAKYVNFNLNSLPPVNDGSSGGMFSRVMSAGSSLNSNTILIIGVIILFAFLSILYYFYYIAPASKSNYRPNSEQVPTGASSNTAELMFFYADWCPHCKAAKPIWNDLNIEYENKTINGYKVIFTEVDCSEETDEVEKLMNQYSIEGYPTIKLIKNGELIDYDAKPSKESLTQFLNTVL